MRKNRPELYLAIFIIAVIAVTVSLYQETGGKNTTGMFPEKLGDMNLALYRDGDAAMNSRVGKTGMFSDPIPMSIEGITVYFVYGFCGG